MLEWELGKVLPSEISEKHIGHLCEDILRAAKLKTFQKIIYLSCLCDKRMKAFLFLEVLKQ